MDLIETAERAWNGDAGLGAMMGQGDLGEVADGVAVVPSFSNLLPLRTDDGLVCIDASGAQ